MMNNLCTLFAVALATISSSCSGVRLAEPTATIHAQRSVAAIAFSPSGSTLATGGNDWNGGRPGFSVVLWDASSWTASRRLPIPEQVQAVSFAPDGKGIAVADGDYQGQGHAYLFDPATGVSLRTFGGSIGWVHGVAFSPAGDTLAACGSTWESAGVVQGYKDGQVMAWDVPGGREQLIPRKESAPCKAIAFNPKGGSIVVGGGDKSGEISLRDATTGRPFWIQQGHSQVVECVAFAADGKMVASGGMDGNLKLWNAADGKELFAASCGRGRLGRVLSVAFAPSGQYLVASVGSYNREDRWGEIRAWRIHAEKLQEIPVFEGATPITCVAFSPDGKLLAAGDSQGTLRVWRSDQVFVTVQRD